MHTVAPDSGQQHPVVVAHRAHRAADLGPPAPRLQAALDDPLDNGHGGRILSLEVGLYRDSWAGWTRIRRLGLVGI